MSPDVDQGVASVMVHLGAPGTVAVREFHGADPFVSLEVIPGVALLSSDPEALLSCERAVQDARQRLSELLDATEGELGLTAESYDADESVEIYDPDGTVQALLAQSAGDDGAGSGSSVSQAFGVGGRS